MAGGIEPKRVLVIDGEEPAADAIEDCLAGGGFLTVVAPTGREGLRLWMRWRPHLIVLDLALPDLLGEELCRAFAERADARIIIITARTSEADLLAGFALGADDYVTKPFSPRLLAARIRAVLRRSDASAPLVDEICLDSGRLVIENATRTVRVDGVPYGLTPTEYRMLVALARQPGRVWSRAELLSVVGDPRTSERAVDAHVKNLRRKLGDDPVRPRYIATAFGRGYRLGVR